MSINFLYDAFGHCLIKPMLMCLSPQAIKAKNIRPVSVFLSGNRKAQLMKQFLLHFFNICFVHEVQLHLKSKNITFEVLCVLDNFSRASADLGLPHSNIQISKNTTSLLQLLNQGNIMFFKSH